MKNLLEYLCICLILLPLGTGAEIIGEVVFRHPDNSNELWITDLADADTARLLYQQTHPIRDFSVQKNGRYIATITEYSEAAPYDIYLIDTDNIDQAERMMTHRRFNKILDVDLSQSPHLLFTNFLPIRGDKSKVDIFGPAMSGIYLISKKEIVDPTLSTPPPVPPNLRDILPPRGVLSPRVSVIKGVEAQHVALSPDNKYLAYDTPGGVYLLKFAIGQVLRVSIGGSMPIFSPDGTKLAVVYRRGTIFGFVYDLDIYSVPSLHLLKTVKNFNSHFDFLDVKWSPDGKYIVYTTYSRSLPGQDRSYHHYAIPYDGGEQFKILEGIFENGVPMFDWVTSEVPYTVEPQNRLTTLWGRLKQ